MSEQVPATIESAGPSGDVTAKAGRYYRNTRYLLALALLGYGIWNIHDGFFSWPEINRQYRQQNPQADKLPYSDMDLLFNKALGSVLPPCALLLLCLSLWNSRGEYRLAGDTLAIPGRKPLKLEQIESVDKQKWDRKGIAVVTYKERNGRLFKFKLDDFVYERQGIDEIYKRIEESLIQPRQPEPAPRAAAMPPPPPPRRSA